MSDLSYEELPYASQALPAAHPDRLHVVARMSGLTPPAVEGARVLEIGCASGGNLIPLAAALPGAQFVGIDYAEVQIAAGRSRAGELGLENLSFRHVDLRDPGEDLGTFDYIIANGVYSWVPTDVADALLALTARVLAPDGVAMISFNVLPGWHARSRIRELLLRRVDRSAPALQQVRRAREVLEELARFAVSDTPWGASLQREFAKLANVADAYFFHEFLEAHNHPVWLEDWFAHVGGHGLRHLGDADFGAMLPHRLPPATREGLAGLTFEQAEARLDLLTGRAFRLGLLCHAHHTPDLRLDWTRFLGLHLGGRLVRAGQDGDAVIFRSRSGEELRVSDPAAVGLLSALDRAGAATLPFEALCDRAGGPRAAPGIAANLLTLWARDAVEVFSRPIPATSSPGERPRAWRIARDEAGREGSPVTSLRHEPWQLDDFDRQLLQACDGERDLDALVHAMVQACSTGSLRITSQGQVLEDPERLQPLMSRYVPQQLRELARKGLLEAT